MLVAHGFAGSQQMIADRHDVARDGYLAITFDFAGHGRNTLPLHGGIVDLAKSTNQLLDELDDVAAYARTRPRVQRPARPGRPLHGVRVGGAIRDRRNDIAATVALSLFGRTVTATSPRNLLVIDGAWEFAR